MIWLRDFLVKSRRHSVDGTKYLALAIVACFASSARAHTGAAAMWFVWGPFVAAAFLIAVFAVSYVIALAGNVLLKKRSKSPGLIALTFFIAMVVGPLSVGGYVASEKIKKYRQSQLSNASVFAQDVICKEDETSWRAKLSQVLPKVGSNGLLSYAQSCVVEKGNVSGFRTLISLQADALNWRKTDAPPQEFCEWITLALRTKRKDFVAAFRAEGLPLHCTGTVANRTGLIVPWFSRFFDTDRSQHADWMAFLIEQGAKTDMRSAYESKTIIDFTAYQSRPELYRYLLGIGVKPNEHSTSHWSTRQWFALRKANDLCEPKPETIEMDGSIGPLTSNDINAIASPDGARFYEVLLDKNRANHWGDSACEQQRLVEILALKPIIDKPLSRLVIHGNMGVSPALFRALDELSPLQAAYLAGLVDGKEQGTFRDSKRITIDGRLIDYLRSRGVKIET
jgi:hypothetical protein